ncbi:MAG: hypothetical protein GC152_14855 [Alphaproteobacteria bacterium]|nr:hypothetical protein [Alphaproteobacteria bacterium]
MSTGPSFPEINFIELLVGLDDLQQSIASRIADLEFRKKLDVHRMNIGWLTHLDEEDIENSQLERLNDLKKESGSLASVVREKYGWPKFQDY